MASQAAHEQLAAANQQLAQSLADAGEHRWAIIVAFYAALHYESALLAGLGIDTDFFDQHSMRDSKIMSHLPDTWADYDEIKGQSVKARYLPGATVDDAAYRRARKRLRRIVDYWSRYRNTL